MTAGIDCNYEPAVSKQPLEQMSQLSCVLVGVKIVAVLVYYVGLRNFQPGEIAIMQCRRLCSMTLTAVMVTMTFFAANLHAGKKPNEKPKEAPRPPAPHLPHPGRKIPNLEFITRLRQEEYNYSQVMDLMSHLTDDIGPRLTGSPNMKKANEWTRDEFTKWGLANAHLGVLGHVRARLGLPTLRSPHDLARLHAVPGAPRGLDAGDQRTAAR